MIAAHLQIGRTLKNCPGETVCGDAALVCVRASHTLVALADGLGHGPEAQRAARSFCDHVEGGAGAPAELMRQAHRAIAGSRGVAAMILRFDHALGTLDAVGVGNVECHAISRAPIRPVSSPGVVGHNLRRLTELSYQTHSGDWLALVSDGVSSRVDFETYRTLEAQRAAELIVQNHSRGTDDSSCVVIRVC